MDLNAIPNREALVDVLKADGAPPWLMLDIGGSDFDGDGVIYVGLDAAGELVEVRP